MLSIFRSARKQLSKLSAVTVPLVIYFVVSYFLSNEKSGAGSVFGSFLSLYFIIGPGLADLFKNLATMHLTKPFDVGDLITIDDELYYVKEIGFQFTSLAGNKGIVIHPNLLFTKKVIKKTKNFGTVKESIQIAFKKKYNQDKLVTIINELIAKETDCYGKSITIHSHSMKDDRHSINLDLEILYDDSKCAGIEQKRDKIVLHLIHNADQLDIVEVSHSKAG